ncbi:MAG: succinylglutamate desuccinylase/aspartoacylase family protein [Henriciella sp.]
MQSQKPLPFEIAGTLVAPGSAQDIDLVVSAMANRQPMSLPVKVIHGRKPGPVMFVSAAVHGDEIIGVEIIRRLTKRPSLKGLSGTLILVPIVNGYGFLNRSRYLPDRRDLNRCFPGSERGSLAARLALLFMEEIVSKSDIGIDLHSAAIHRENLPQIRVSADDARALELAKTFGAPALVTSPIRGGSLRKAAADVGVPVLLFEGGEGLRFNEQAVRAGLAGILRVMKSAGMITSEKVSDAKIASFAATKSTWLRAPEGGLLRLKRSLGASVKKGDVLGVVTDIFSTQEFPVSSEYDGIIIGRSTLPTVNEGDAILHIARAAQTSDARDRVEAIVGQLADADMFYEDEII